MKVQIGEKIQVYTSPFKKVRIGKEFDCGYVITEIPNMTYKLLLIEQDI